MGYKIDEFTVWIFYLKEKPNQVYAYTTDKEIKNLFLDLRNPKAFHMEKLTMDEFEFSMFANNHKDEKMNIEDMAISLKSGGPYLKVATTSTEQKLCAEKYYQLDHEMEDLYRGLILHSSIKGKYKKAIEYLLDTTYDMKYPGGVQNTSRCNEFALFIHLFKDTMRNPKSIIVGDEK